MLLGKHLPAAVITLVGDVTFAEFSFQLPQVQPCLIVLGNESRRTKFQCQIRLKVNGLLCVQSTSTSNHF